jgi:hypothetical protein
MATLYWAGNEGKNYLFLFPITKIEQKQLCKTSE